MTLRSSWYIVSRRAHNRWLDLRGRLSGYCMADTWREVTPKGPGYSPGYPHWRCWRKRHPSSEEHRFNNYVWRTGEPPAYLPIDSGFNPGTPPAWGKHHLTAPRGRSRRVRRYVERQAHLRRDAAAIRIAQGEGDAT